MTTAQITELASLAMWARDTAPGHYPARPTDRTDQAAICRWLEATRNQSLDLARQRITLAMWLVLEGSTAAAVELKADARRFLDLARGIGDMRP